MQDVFCAEGRSDPTLLCTPADTVAQLVSEGRHPCSDLRVLRPPGDGPYGGASTLLASHRIALAQETSAPVAAPAKAFKDEDMVVNGTHYYQAGPNWYKPYFGSSGVYYEVVPAP